MDQQAALEQVVKWAKLDDNIRALVLTGSVARDVQAVGQGMGRIGGNEQEGMLREALRQPPPGRGRTGGLAGPAFASEQQQLQACVA